MHAQETLGKGSGQRQPSPGPPRSQPARKHSPMGRLLKRQRAQPRHWDPEGTGWSPQGRGAETGAQPCHRLAGRAEANLVAVQLSQAHSKCPAPVLALPASAKTAAAIRGFLLLSLNGEKKCFSSQGWGGGEGGKGLHRQLH